MISKFDDMMPHRQQRFSSGVVLLPMRIPVLALVCMTGATAICISSNRGTALAQMLEANEHSTITLTQAIALARTNYPAIQAAQAQQKAAQGAVGVARTAYLPRTDLLWQTNRATANNVYGLLLPQGVIPS